ncbi:hypothetical protein B0H66DRAFT_581333 [Apodospora peruviana]|uniref:Uncharacterized protein n=1 Tax=Apodospora peruviana TaxID=516989 RepID=A0AAE0M7K3_9PEZI|nr:hypothetical protein B0H66DRAFT_581333 [Apodospora peruviana]
MPSDDKDLRVILEAKEKRDFAPNVTSQIIVEMKSSLLFQFSWEELLQSAPTAISSMGACFIASSSKKATLPLTPPSDKGFQYLKYPSVQANLVECTNLGRYAFLEAENGMGVIQLTSKAMNAKINDIVGSLGDPMLAKKLLRPQLGLLNGGARKCYDVAVAMDKKFESWLLYVCEMHAACVQQEVTTRDALLSNQICFAAEQTRLDYQKETAQEARKAADLVAKQVDLAADAFKQASEEFPSGWDLMGQQIVSDLAGAVNTALNAAMLALLDNLNPIAQPKAVVGGFVNGGDKGAPSNITPGQSTNTQNGVPKQTTDPAYVEIQKLATLLAALRVIISGQSSTGGIDWEKAKSSIKFISSMLRYSNKQFSSVATSAEPSITLSQILATASTVAAGIEAEVNKSKSVNWTSLHEDSQQVQTWQADFAAQYREANTLLATAKSIPGTAANGTAQINAKTTQVQAVLESAKNSLSTTQQMLTTAQENYTKTTGMVLEQQNKLRDIQAILTKLTAGNISLDEIKRILIECIKLIIILKQQVSNLVRFFKAMVSAVDICVKSYVEPFLETVKAIGANDGNDPYEKLKIGDITLTDLQRSNIYSIAVTLRSYFSIFGDIAKMWVDLSKESVMPGLSLCDDISQTVEGPWANEAEVKKRVTTLYDWSRKASERVAQVMRDKQAETLDSMESRIQEVKDTTSRIEPPAAEIAKAIEAGIEVTRAAATKSIEARATTSALSRFAIADDE